jgi:fatty acyl-CoA reductase
MARHKKVCGHCLNRFIFLRLLKIYKKINKFCDVISYFSTRDWKFTNKNVQELWQKLDEDDRKLFDFNLDELDWDKYFYTYVRGIRLYLLKDDVSTLPQAIARYKRYVA